MSNDLSACLNGGNERKHLLNRNNLNKQRRCWKDETKGCGRAWSLWIFVASLSSSKVHLLSLLELSSHILPHTSRRMEQEYSCPCSWTWGRWGCWCTPWWCTGAGCTSPPGCSPLSLQLGRCRSKSSSPCSYCRSPCESSHWTRPCMCRWRCATPDTCSAPPCRRQRWGFPPREVCIRLTWPGNPSMWLLRSSSVFRLSHAHQGLTVWTR